MFMLITKLYLKVLVVKILPHRTESGADVGISNRGGVHTLITFESMGLDGKCQRCKLLRCLGDNFFNFLCSTPPLDLPLLNRNVLYLSVFWTVKVDTCRLIYQNF